MEFMQVFGACHNFAMARGGTIAAYPPGQEKFVLESRTGRTEILIERDPAQPRGGWLAEQRQDANGERNPIKARFDTEEGLLRCVLGFWREQVDPPRLSQVLESPASLVQQ